MRSSFLAYLCIGMFILTSNALAGAFEIGLLGGVDNMTFHPDRITAHGDSVNYKQFQNYPFGFGEFFLKDDITANSAFNVRLSRDNILRNRVITGVSAYTDYLEVEFGPFAGINDDFDRIDMGVLGSLNIFYPGIAFLNINGSSTLSNLHDFF